MAGEVREDYMEELSLELDHTGSVTFVWISVIIAAKYFTALIKCLLCF